jgi:UDP-glucuronate decarboxylase
MPSVAPRFLLIIGGLESYVMPFAKEKRILVTGGAGLIGSALCARLVAEGHDIICLDNFSVGSKRNIHTLVGEPGFEIIRRDVILPVVLEVDEIYHLACPPTTHHRSVKPVETTKTCALGSINLLELASRVNAKILLASSAQVYRKSGELLPRQTRAQDNASPDAGMFHRQGNRCAEILFFGYHQQYDLDIRIARIFSTFGPGMQIRGGSVVADFINHALKNEDLTIYGDGSQTFPLCFVDDIVEGLLLIMNGPEDLIGPVDLGNPSEISIFDLAQSIIQLSGSRSGIIFEPLQENEPISLHPDIELAQRHLKWHPQKDIIPGLKQTIEFFHSCAES